MKLSENEYQVKIGLDATIFLRFTKMLRNMFLFICVVAMGLLLPVNIYTGGRSKEAKSFGATGFWSVSTPVYTHGQALWAHVVAAYAIDAIVIFFLWRTYMAVVRLKRNYFESPEYLQSLHARTLMLMDMPPASRTDEGILRLCDQVESTASIPRAAITRNVKELPALIEKHEDTVKKLESILAKYLKNPDRLPARPTIRPGKDMRGAGQVDAIDYLMDRILELEAEIKHVRDSIDRRNPMAFGFASYERIEDAHKVAYAARKKKPQGTTISLAPRPTDIIWKNIPLSRADRRWKLFVNNFWIVLLTLIWIAPNAMIAIFLSNLSNLANIWKGFDKTYRENPKSWAIVQGIASPAITSLLYLLLPIAFRRLYQRAGDVSRTSRERHVTQKLFGFFVFNNLIVFSAFSGVWAYVATIIGTRQNEDLDVWERIKEVNFFRTLLNALIDISPFWLTWLLQRNLGSAADLSQMIQLFWVWYGKTFTSPTPRQRIALTAPVPFEYAVYYNYFLFYATVALCFASVQPLVVPITAFYFVVDYWLKKYLLLYVLITKHESGGQFWRMLYNRLVFALILANFIAALVVKAWGTWTMVACMAPLPIILIGFKWYCARAFDDQIGFYTKAITLKDPENMADPGKAARRVAGVNKRFGHPALNGKLMTPMVHAKASSVLSQLYRGNHRLAQDQPLGFSAGQNTMATKLDMSENIAMNPMSNTYPGKSSTFSMPGHTATGSTGGITSASGKRGLFELVPENKLDFSYFKSRSDFADEFGGDGDLYGKPSDLVSEAGGGRSTPMSFMHGRGDSPSSSRAGSPAPYGQSPPPPLSPQQQQYNRALSPQSQQMAMQNMYATHQQQQHQPYHDRNVSGGNARPPFRSAPSADSDAGLLPSAFPPGQSTPYAYETQGRDTREIYGMDRWRNGGSGYVGVPGGGGEDVFDPHHGGNAGAGGGYDAYRGMGGGGGGQHGPYESYRGASGAYRG